GGAPAGRGGFLAGWAGGGTDVIVTELIKRVLAIASSQGMGGMILVPLCGLTIAVAILHAYSHGKALQTIAPEPVQPPRRRWGLNWRDPRDVIRADLTADVLATAGEEERFPWRLAPIRAVAIVAT